ncbi:MAG TPA: septum formation initiator family protein [Acidimicrobiales bacterium]|nr:septum formation initiator family protein [Acidimicrobiales bacterium]
MRRAAWPFVISVIVVGVLFLAVFPTRTYVQQRSKLAATEKRLAVLSEQNERLAARIRKLNTDEEIERLAREQYSLVRPGEEAYAILPAPRPDPAPEAPAEKRDEPGLWGRLWDGVTFWS